MRILWVFGLVVLAASVAFGQGTGTFNGRVVDQAGGVIPGARVTVTAITNGLTSPFGAISLNLVSRLFIGLRPCLRGVPLSSGITA